MRGFLFKIGLVTAFILSVGIKGFAQQDPTYTQFMFNKLVINPAYAGSNDMLSAQLLARNQWVGFPGAPKTRTFSVHSPISDYQFGGGISFTNDVLGPVHNNRLYFDMAYHLPITKDGGMLSMGLKGGFDMMNQDLTGVNIIDPTDPGYDENFVDNFMLNLGFGFYYHTEKWYAGFSAPRLFKHTVENDGTNENYGVERAHWYLIGGYIFEINDMLKIHPSTMAKMVSDSPITFDISTYAIFYDQLWAGLSYRYGDAIAIIAQFQASTQFRIGYAYDISVSDSRTYQGGSHEIAISYDLRYRKKQMVSPRYF